METVSGVLLLISKDINSHARIYISSPKSVNNQIEFPNITYIILWGIRTCIAKWGFRFEKWCMSTVGVEIRANKRNRFQSKQYKLVCGAHCYHSEWLSAVHYSSSHVLLHTITLCINIFISRGWFGTPTTRKLASCIA